MNHCKDCKLRAKDGYCESEHFIEGRYDPDDEHPADVVYSYNEGGSFWVGPEFGCIHWEKSPVQLRQA